MVTIQTFSTTIRKSSNKAICHAKFCYSASGSKQLANENKLDAGFVSIDLNTEWIMSRDLFTLLFTAVLNWWVKRRTKKRTKDTDNFLLSAEELQTSKI
jgi:hypothetical protein